MPACAYLPPDYLDVGDVVIESEPPEEKLTTAYTTSTSAAPFATIERRPTFHIALRGRRRRASKDISMSIRARGKAIRGRMEKGTTGIRAW